MNVFTKEEDTIEMSFLTETLLYLCNCNQSDCCHQLLMLYYIIKMFVDIDIACDANFFFAFKRIPSQTVLCVDIFFKFESKSEK